jgi:putative mRNA 3-end processing factor
MTRVEDWLKVRPQGLYCEAGDFYVDPTRPSDRAIVTHGHADHARPGNGAVLATPETLAIMAVRYGAEAIGAQQALRYGERLRIGEATISLHPAGHILGSAQLRIEHAGAVAVISGDYKRRADLTCAPFEPVPCDVFITEATFGLPVFRHPDDRGEVAKLLRSVQMFPDRAHVVGVYALGKCQRLITLLRAAGWDRPIWLHGALQNLCELYQSFGATLGPLRSATVAEGKAEGGASAFAGEIVLAPPSAIADRWSRRLPDPVVSVASGWMRVRQRAKQRGVELPLIISDHADWDELLATIDDVAAPEVWVTHGREEALLRAAALRGVKARALALVGFEEEGS